MLQRNLALAALAEKELDLVVIGGGLLGAGIALEAASRGHSVLVVDKDDFASGSSSRTSKVAGAAQYIQPGQNNRSGLAWKDARGAQALEQLHQLAPHMVKDFSFLMPIAPGSLIASLATQTGLALNDALTGKLGKSSAHKRLSRKETLRASQALAPDMVVGGLRFHDYFTDDSRFVIELTKAASRRGALAINYLEAQNLVCQDDKVHSIILRDRISGQEITVQTKTVVSACGVWTDVTTGLPADRIIEGGSAPPVVDPPLKLRRSTHIILPPSALETNGGALLLSGAAGDLVFVVPWQRALLVGTTSSEHLDGPENPLPTTAEIEYLLHAVNRYTRFDRKVTGADVACAWAGLTCEAVEKSNKPSVYRGANAVIIAYGGHLANYAEVAREAVRLVDYQLKANNPQSPLAMLSGFTDRQDFLTTTAAIAAGARKVGLDPASYDHLQSSYGKDALKILDLLEKDPTLNERICPDFPQLMAEVVYIIENEMAISLEDILCRRLRLGFLHREQCLDAAPRVAKMMQQMCNWDTLRLKGELSALARKLASQLAPVA